MIFFLFLALISTQINAMEKGARLVMVDDATPLLKPDRILMDEAPSTFFDGTRRYYDEASRKKVCSKAFKRCVCQTVLSGVGSGCFGCILGQICGSILAGCLANTTGMLFAPYPGGIFLEWGIMCGGASSGIGGIMEGAIFCCEARANIQNDPDKVLLNQSLKISPHILDAADENKKIWIEKKVLEKLLNPKTKDNIFVGFGSCVLDCVTCEYRSESKYIGAVAKRLKIKNMLGMLLAHTFKTKHGVPKDVIKYLFQFIDTSEIRAYSYVSEKELLHLINIPHHTYDTRGRIADYKSQISLEQNGWISFTQSAKYPIKCEPAYFDPHAMPVKLKRSFPYRYGQTMYLPYNPVLAQYYKFEEDPAYKQEFTHPTSVLISALLSERSRLIRHKKIQALGLPGEVDEMVAIEL